MTCLKSSSEGVVHAATADHNLVTVSLPQLTITDTLVGNNDEILDLAYMGKGVERMMFMILKITLMMIVLKKKIMMIILKTKIILKMTIMMNLNLILDQSHLVVACNSPSLRLYSVSSWKCHLVPGHSES